MGLLTQLAGFQNHILFVHRPNTSQDPIRIVPRRGKLRQTASGTAEVFNNQSAILPTAKSLDLMQGQPKSVSGSSFSSFSHQCYYEVMLSKTKHEAAGEQYTI